VTKRTTGNRSPDRVYEIRDAEGRLVAEHHRFDEPDGDKKCLWKLPHTGPRDYGLKGLRLEELPLYGAEMISDLGIDELVTVVEGEKARDALEAAGIPAVGTVTGSGTTPGREALEILRDRRVALWPDADAAGELHMERVAERLHGLAAEVLVYTWHDAPADVKGPDAADHPAVQSRNRKALDRLLTDLESAPRWRPSALRRTFTAAELMDEELPPIREVVPRILPEGVSLLAGKPKLGKSWLCLGLCIATATGGHALGKTKVEKGAALYLALEDNRRRMRKRLKKLLTHSAPPRDLHIALEWPRLNEGGADELRAWLNENPDARLVVIDTLAKIREPARGQNVYAEDYKALEKLIPLAAEYSVAVLVVTHLRKLSAADPLDEISGSTGLSGGVDGFLILKRDRGRHDATLHVDGRDVEEPAELALTWDGELASWTLAGDAEEFRMSVERAKIREVLEASEEPMSPKEIAAALGVDTNNISQRLYQMKQAGQVKTPNYGCYTVAKTDKSHTSDKTDKSHKSSGLLSAGTSGDKGSDKSVSRTDKPDPDSFTSFSGFIEGAENGSNKTRGLSAAEVAEELRRAGSGPARALSNYLEKPGSRQRLEYLTIAVLVARGLDTDAWKAYAGAVEKAAVDPQNHPLSCGCEGCTL
jgi:RecA-family ATPase